MSVLQQAHVIEMHLGFLPTDVSYDDCLGLCPPRRARTSLWYLGDRESVAHGISADLLRLGKTASSTISVFAHMYTLITCQTHVYGCRYMCRCAHTCMHAHTFKAKLKWAMR